MQIKTENGEIQEVSSYIPIIVDTVSPLLEEIFGKKSEKIYMGDLELLRIAGEMEQGAQKSSLGEEVRKKIQDPQVKKALSKVATEVKELIFLLETPDMRKKRHRPDKGDTTQDYLYLYETFDLIATSYAELFPQIQKNHQDVIPGQVSFHQLNEWLQKGKISELHTFSSEECREKYEKVVDAFLQKSENFYTHLPGAWQNRIPHSQYLWTYAAWGLDKLRAMWRKHPFIRAQIDLEKLGSKGLLARGGISEEEALLALYLNELNRFFSAARETDCLGGIWELQAALYYKLI